MEISEPSTIQEYCQQSVVDVIIPFDNNNTIALYVHCEHYPISELFGEFIVVWQEKYQMFLVNATLSFICFLMTNKYELVFPFRVFPTYNIHIHRHTCLSINFWDIPNFYDSIT